MSASFNPADLIGRTFLLPPESNGERHQAKVTKQVIESNNNDNTQPTADQIKFAIGKGTGQVEEIITYNQLMGYLEDNDLEQGEISDGLYHFRGIIGHQGPLDSKHPN